jgi:AcrR family transcriptional regulator
MTVRVVSPIGVARERLLATALDLFICHGVNNTSLPMLADALEVPRSAVHRQFPTKSDLLLALITPAVAQMNRLADAAQAHRSVASRREIILAGVVDLVVANRRLAVVIHSDPIVSRIFREHPPLVAVSERLTQLLTGPDLDAAILVGIAVLGGGLMMVSLDQELADLDDETLRRQLLSTARRTLRLRTPARQRSGAQAAVASPR